MPGRDMTGPQGQGPMTGRGLGRCAGNTGFTPGMGRRRGQQAGMGLGLGRRRGAGWAANAGNAIAVNEKQTLEEQAQLLEDRLSEVKQRLTEINSIDK